MKYYKTNNKKCRIHKRPADKSSIKMVIMSPNDKRKKDMKSAATKILDDAKLNNPMFNIQVLRSTYKRNWDSESNEKAEEYGIKEVQLNYCGGDTDSSKFMFAILLKKNTISHDQTRAWLQRQICMFCKDLLDKSHPYFDQLGIRNIAEKKKPGLMSFDEIDDKSSLDDPLYYAIYTNPKEYCEQAKSSFENRTVGRSMKHKSISRHNKEMSISMYHRRLRSHQEINDMKQRKEKDEVLSKKLSQNNLKRTKDGIRFNEMQKVCLNRLSDKSPILSNGLMSVSYGHPDWQKFVVEKRIEEYDDRNETEKMYYSLDHKKIVQSTDLIEDVKNEQNVIIRNRHLELLQTIFNINIDGVPIKQKAYDIFMSQDNGKNVLPTEILDE